MNELPIFQPCYEAKRKKPLSHSVILVKAVVVIIQYIIQYIIVVWNYLPSEFLSLFLALLRRCLFPKKTEGKISELRCIITTKIALSLKKEQPNSSTKIVCCTYKSPCKRMNTKDSLKPNCKTCPHLCFFFTHTQKLQHQSFECGYQYYLNQRLPKLAGWVYIPICTFHSSSCKQLSQREYLKLFLDWIIGSSDENLNRQVFSRDRKRYR